MMTDDEFEEAYEKYVDMCTIVAKVLKKGEYCRTCEDLFNMIENKHLDVSSIVPNNEYEEFKRRLLAEDCGGMEIGDVPKPKYDMNTAEGHMAYYRDNPDIDITF